MYINNWNLYKLTQLSISQFHRVTLPHPAARVIHHDWNLQIW